MISTESVALLSVIDNADKTGPQYLLIDEKRQPSLAGKLNS